MRSATPAPAGTAVSSESSKHIGAIRRLRISDTQLYCAFPFLPVLISANTPLPATRLPSDLRRLIGRQCQIEADSSLPARRAAPTFQQRNARMLTGQPQIRMPTRQSMLSRFSNARTEKKFKHPREISNCLNGVLRRHGAMFKPANTIYYKQGIPLQMLTSVFGPPSI
jgi:hypothetical protein